jgi:hypothetical protein
MVLAVFFCARGRTEALPLKPDIRFWQRLCKNAELMSGVGKLCLRRNRMTEI